MLGRRIKSRKLAFERLVESGGQIGQKNWDAVRAMPFLLTARPSQLPPPNTPEDWRTWLFMGGRGAGKTRAGAEWVRYMALFGGARRIALVGPTIADVREVMIEGESGLKNLEWRHSPYEPPVYETSRRRLVFGNGAEAFVFSSEDPDSLRGPQFHAAWCDEIGAWNNDQECWDMLQFTLRLGNSPQCMATTTPRNTKLIQELLEDADDNESGVVLTRGSTFDNSENLSKSFLTAMTARYGQCELGKQELFGEFVSDESDGLWQKRDIEAAKKRAVPTRYDEIVVAIDPPVTSGKKADACGIIVAGRWHQDGALHMAILGDHTVQGLTPLEWAMHATKIAEQYNADLIVIETNQGGEMLELTLRTAGCQHRIKNVRAVKSKTERACQALLHYSMDRVAHACDLHALEAEMLIFDTPAMRRSPDRVDAAVWALAHLFESGRSVPRIRWL